jgi:hypothetical protein
MTDQSIPPFTFSFEVEAVVMRDTVLEAVRAAGRKEVVDTSMIRSAAFTNTARTKLQSEAPRQSLHTIIVERWSNTRLQR